MNEPVAPKEPAERAQGQATTATVAANQTPPAAPATDSAAFPALPLETCVLYVAVEAAAVILLIYLGFQMMALARADLGGPKDATGHYVNQALVVSQLGLRIAIVTAAGFLVSAAVNFRREFLAKILNATVCVYAVLAAIAAYVLATAG